MPKMFRNGEKFKTSSTIIKYLSGKRTNFRGKSAFFPESLGGSEILTYFCIKTDGYDYRRKRKIHQPLYRLRV